MYKLAHGYIADGDAGIVTTVEAMFAMIADGAQHPLVQAQAAEITAATADPESAILALRQWCADRWVFRDDPELAETLYAPDVQLDLIAKHGRMEADCDDAAILFGSLGRAIGCEVRIICVGFLTNDAPYSHTWAELRPPLGAGCWVEGDVTRTMQAIPMDRIGRAAAWSLT